MATANDSSLLHLLHRAMQVGTERFARELGDTDLTARQLVILKAIAANEGASQTAIVNLTGVDRSTLADVVKRLLQRRLLARKRSKADARAYQLTLTDDGRAAVAQAEPILKAVEKQLLAAIPAKQRAELLTMLDTLATAA